jgi:hypothetical protein
MTDTVVEFLEEFEDEWGDDGQTSTKILFDSDGYEEGFSDVVKEMDWSEVHYQAEFDDDDEWKGWSADADKIDQIKQHFKDRGYATVDLR